MRGVVSWLVRTRRAALALTAIVAPLSCLAASANAQNFVRPPNLNIGPRVPQINPNVARGDVAIRAMRTPTPNIATRINVSPTVPYLHYSPNLYPSCGAAFRDGDGECLGEPVSTGGGNGASGNGNGKSKSSRRTNNNTVQSVLNLRTYANHIVAEIDGTLS